MLPIEVLRSAAGYYIGALNTDGEPYERLSHYYKNEEAAKEAMEYGFIARNNGETTTILVEHLRKGELQRSASGLLCVPKETK